MTVMVQQQQDQWQQQQPPPPTQTHTLSRPVYLTSSGIVDEQPTPESVAIRRSFNPTIAETYSKRQSMAIAFVLLFDSILIIIFNSIGIAAGDFSSAVGLGYSCASVFGITVSCAAAAASQIRKKIKNFCFSATLSGLAACAMFSLEIYESMLDVNCPPSSWRSSANSYSYWCPKNESLAVACKSIKAALAGVALIACIWGLLICLQALLCCPQQTNNVVVSQLSEAGQYVHPQMTTLSEPPPSYQLESDQNQYSVPYPPTQQQYFSGELPPHYSVASETTQSDVTPAVTSLPIHTEFDVEKESF